MVGGGSSVKDWKRSLILLFVTVSSVYYHQVNVDFSLAFLKIIVHHENVIVM